MTQEFTHNGVIVTCLCGSTEVEIREVYKLPETRPISPLEYTCLACGQTAVDAEGKKYLWQLINRLQQAKAEYRKE